MIFRHKSDIISEFSLQSLDQLIFFSSSPYLKIFLLFHGHLRRDLVGGTTVEEILEVADWEVVPDLPVGDDIIEPGDLLETLKVLRVLVLLRSHALVMLPEGPFVQSQLLSQDLIEFLLWLLSLSRVAP